jgi:Holliday junction resolvasome RuvABC DNA-binding subunit
VVKVKSAPKPAIYEDCVLALVATGYGKKVAREMADKVFETHNPQTVEQFVFKAFKK